MISYGRKRPADVHYEALVAEFQPRIPSLDDRVAMREHAQDLASRISPDDVHPYYVARLAAAENALQSPVNLNLWTEAANDAVDNAPVPPGAQAIADTLKAPAGEEGDSSLEKIAKYVPAEMITVTTLAFAAIKPGGADVWWLVAAGAAANSLYLFGAALQARKETKEMPRWYFYPLSALALSLWALAVIPIVGSEFGFESESEEAQKTFALAFAAFLVPLLDVIATGTTEWYVERHPKSITKA